jgi:hypothetical protein
MFVVASQNEVGLHSTNRGIIKGWLHNDEPVNAQPIGVVFMEVVFRPLRLFAEPK